jgi:putative salt-induced outer membrane protein YdiY
MKITSLYSHHLSIGARSCSMVVFAVLCVFSGHVHADEVFLKNGDKLTGTVVSKAKDKLVFETKYAGKIKINWADISRLTTVDPVRIQLGENKMLEGPLTSPAEDTLAIADTVEGAEQVPLADVAAINPPDLSGLRYSGFFNVGLVKSEGNTDEERYHIDGETTLRWPKDRLIFAINGDYQQTDGDDTKQVFNSFNTYDYFIDKQLFWDSGLSFEHDKFADLRLRTTVTTGLGYQIYDEEDLSLSIQGGPGYIWEDFYAGENDDYAAAIWALRYRQVLLPEWELEAFHNHRISLSLEEIENYIFISQTGLRVPIFDNFQTTIQVNFDWNNDPGAGASKNDTTYLFTVGYTW